MGIVFAAQVNNKQAAGDYEGALKASKEAGRWTKIGFFAGITIAVLWLAFVFLFGGWAIMQNRNNY